MRFVSHKAGLDASRQRRAGHRQAQGPPLRPVHRRRHDRQVGADRARGSRLTSSSWKKHGRWVGPTSCCWARSRRGLFSSATPGRFLPSCRSTPPDGKRRRVRPTDRRPNLILREHRGEALALIAPGDASAAGIHARPDSAVLRLQFECWAAPAERELRPEDRTRAVRRCGRTLGRASVVGVALATPDGGPPLECESPIAQAAVDTVRAMLECQAGIPYRREAQAAGALRHRTVRHPSRHECGDAPSTGSEASRRGDRHARAVAGTGAPGHGHGASAFWGCSAERVRSRDWASCASWRRAIRSPWSW